MIMRFRTVGLCAMGLLVAGPVHATKLAGEFMALGGGARALGMGGAFAAVADDASAVYWNPAGIAGIEKRQALAMHAEQFGDLVNYNFGAYVQPTSLLDEARKPAFGFGAHPPGRARPARSRTTDSRGPNDNGHSRLLRRDRTAGHLSASYDSIPRESDNSFAGLGTLRSNRRWGAWAGRSS